MFVDEENPFTGEIERVENPSIDQETICADCHDQAGGAWKQARSRVVQWAGRSAKQVCESWVTTSVPGSGFDFSNHIANDPLIRLAFDGRRGMDETPEPPPMSHEAFIAHARAWSVATGIGTPRASICACAGLE